MQVSRAGYEKIQIEYLNRRALVRETARSCLRCDLAESVLHDLYRNGDFWASMTGRDYCYARVDDFYRRCTTTAASGCVSSLDPS